VAGNTIGALTYVVAYLRSGRVWLPIGMHVTWNFAQGALGFPVSGINDYSNVLVHQAATTGSHLLTGGAYGPEAGLVGMLSRLLVLALVVLATRRPAETRTPPPPLATTRA
jgi:hypothetical protein